MVGSVCQCVYPFVLFDYLSVCEVVRLFVRVCVCLYVCLFVSLLVCVCLVECVCVCVCSRACCLLDSAAGCL